MLPSVIMLKQTGLGLANQQKPDVDREVCPHEHAGIYGPGDTVEGASDLLVHPGMASAFPSKIDLVGVNLGDWSGVAVEAHGASSQVHDQANVAEGTFLRAGRRVDDPSLAGKSRVRVC